MRVGLVDCTEDKEKMTEHIEWYWPVGYVEEVLGLHWRKIYGLISAGILKHIKMPSGAIKVSRSSVQKYLDSSDNAK